MEEIAKHALQISNLHSTINRLRPRSSNLLCSLSMATQKDRVLYNRPLSIHVLRDHIQTIERELMVNIQLLGFSGSTQLQQFLMDTSRPTQTDCRFCHRTSRGHNSALVGRKRIMRDN